MRNETLLGRSRPIVPVGAGDPRSFPGQTMGSYDAGEAMKRVSAAEAAEAAAEAAAQAVDSVTALTPHDLRNQDHANMLNVVLEAMNKRGRTRFEPEDISHAYTIMAQLDAIAGNEARKERDAALARKEATSAKAKAVEKAATEPETSVVTPAEERARREEPDAEPRKPEPDERDEIARGKERLTALAEREDRGFSAEDTAKESRHL